MGGIDDSTGLIIIHNDARFAYTPNQLQRFIDMWNDGEPVSRISEKMGITARDVGLLVSHCDYEELITPRKGGLRGTKTHKWKQRQKIRIDDLSVLYPNHERNKK